MARLETWYKQDLKRPLFVHKHTDVFNQDSKGNLIGVEVYSDGEPVVLSGSISGYCLLADGTTVPAVGASRSGNKASVLIPQTAYSVPGPITITIKNVEGDNITTLCATVGIVRQSVSGNLVNPGSVVTDWSNNINAQLQAVQTAADNVGAIVAAPFNENTVYVVGNYVTNNGNLYRIAADHAAGVAWADTTKVQCTVGRELYDLKSAFGVLPFLKDKSINYTSPTIINSEANWECVLVDCNAGDTFYVKGKGGSSTRLWCFSDADGITLTKADSGIAVYSFVKIIAPQNAKHLAVNSNYTVIKGVVLDDSSIIQKEIDDSTETLKNTWIAENESLILFGGSFENKGTNSTVWFIDPIPAGQYTNGLYCMVSELKGADGTQPYIAYVNVQYSDSTSDKTYISEFNKAIQITIDQTKTVSQISFVGYRSNGTVSQSIITTWKTLFYSGNKIADVDAIATNANSYATKSYSSTKQIESIVLGNVDTSELFEVGNISVSTDGWTYENSNSRVRTKEGKTVFLEAGDVIGLKDYTNYRQYIGYKSLINGDYYSSGRWLQEDYIVNSTGEYVWTVTAVPEARVNDLQTYVDQIVIKRMRNLKNDSVKSNINVACHRGYASIAPENTIPAFKLAKQMGYDTVETDIAFTSDSVPVLLHDSTIDRTSNGTGNIEDLTYSYVRTLDFGSWKSPVYAGTKIPSFEELCIFCRSAGLKIYAELKGTENSTKAQMKQLVDISKRCGMVENVTWISFSKQMLLWVAEYLPNARYGLLAPSISSATVSDANDIKAVANNVFVSADLNNIDSTAVGLMIAAEIPLEEYTANRRDHIVNSNPYTTGFTTDNAHPDIILMSSVEVID